MRKRMFGYVNFDFKQFRKYYDTYGGIFNGQSYNLSGDLFLDIGAFWCLRQVITMPDLPNVSVFYEL